MRYCPKCHKPEPYQRFNGGPITVCQCAKEKAADRLADTSCWALAQQIATTILTVYEKDGGTECTRAQMMLKKSDGTEVNMGGRCKASLAQCIAEKLEAVGWPNAIAVAPPTQDSNEAPR